MTFPKGFFGTVKKQAIDGHNIGGILSQKGRTVYLQRSAPEAEQKVWFGNARIYRTNKFYGLE
ncbi:MAG: hypothetical protein LBN01_03135 [Endomicrobium sp.]|nr:hypothetical protein [Endomicrobium sp.]